MNKQERKRYYKRAARVAGKILKEANAIRTADNLTPQGLPLPDLLIRMDEQGYPVCQASYYNQVRPAAIELGIEITAGGTGQYIGKIGEGVARNTHNFVLQARGRAVNTKKNLVAAGEAMSLEEGQKYSMVTWGTSLANVSAYLEAAEKTLNVPVALPPELNTYLIEAETERIEA